MKSLRILCSIALISTSLAYAGDDAMSVGGFIDTQYQWNNSGSPTGVVVNDGAVYFSKKSGDAEAKVDLPFHNTDAGNNSVHIGEGKAQAYLSYTCPKSAVSTKLGQFDTIFGFELNDTKDVFFASQGLVFNQAIPVTHRGALVSIPASSTVTLNLMGAADSSTGVLNGTNPDWGAQVTSSGPVRLAAGALYRKSENESGKSFYLADFVVGTDMGAWTIDAGFDMRREADATTTGKTYLAHLVYKMDDKMSLGARGELLKEMSGFDSQLALTVGPKIALTKELSAKVNYTHSSVKAVTGGESVTTHAGSIGAVYTF